MSEPIIRLQGVGLRYRTGRKHWVLRDLNLDIYRGEKIGVIGRNGCGKSTLLKLLACIFTPDAGRIIVDRRKVQIQLLALGVGFEGQLTGAENAILSGLFMGRTRDQMLSLLDQIHEFSELGESFHQPVNTYSTGMTARLGFAISIQIDPDVFLVDEILGVGDHIFQAKSQAALAEKFHPDRTVVIVSHDAGTLARICTKIVWLEGGTVHATGPAETIFPLYHERTK